MKPKCDARRVGLVRRSRVAGCSNEKVGGKSSALPVDPIEVARHLPGSARAISKPPSHLLAAGMRGPRQAGPKMEQPDTPSK